MLFNPQEPEHSHPPKKGILNGVAAKHLSDGKEQPPPINLRAGEG